MKKTGMKISLATMLAMGVSGPFRRMLRVQARRERPKAKLIRIAWITPGGHHAWCESDCGLIRKPLASVPDEMIAEFRGAGGAA